MIDQKRASIDRYLTAFESGKLPEEACGHRVSALQREIVAMETERSRLEAEYALAPSLPTDDLLGELRAALLRASEEKAVRGPRRRRSVCALTPCLARLRITRL